MTQAQTFLEKCYKDEQGKVRLVQKPNLPVVVWFIAMLLSKVVSTGTFHEVMSIVSFGALFTWAWLELFSGSNYLRRLLGLVVLIAIIHSKLS